MFALVAAHVIIGVSGGQFISMTDPPQWAAPEVAACQNAGTWPVLAGEDGGTGVMLCAPIILYDHPELAPESPGDLYDGTEIDEILTLRTLALTDEEKREARDTDPRAVLFDVSDAPYFAVSLADDPDADVRSAHGRFLYFMPDEVEPCEAGTETEAGA